MSLEKANKELLEAARFTISEIEYRIEQKQVPVALRMLLLALMAAVNNVDRAVKK